MGNGKLKMGVNAAVGAAMLWLLFVTHAVFAGPFEDAALAHAQKDYATALRLLRPLADQGNALGQFNPGNMYDNGQGAPQDYAETQKFAADNRNKPAAETASRPIHFCGGGRFWRQRIKEVSPLEQSAGINHHPQSG